MYIGNNALVLAQYPEVTPMHSESLNTYATNVFPDVDAVYRKEPEMSTLLLLPLIIIGSFQISTPLLTLGCALDHATTVVPDIAGIFADDDWRTTPVLTSFSTSVYLTLVNPM
jgi:hypothetical protein